MLHAVNKDVHVKAYCGPTAIATVTNTPISKIHKMIRRYRNDRFRKIYGRSKPIPASYEKKRITGMHNFELLEIMRRLGNPFKKAYRTKTDGIPGMSLKTFCEDYGHMGPFIVNVTGHYVSVSKGMICDTQTGYKPIPWQDYKRLGWRVVAFWSFKEVKSSSLNQEEDLITVLERHIQADFENARAA